jgi:hypothetical protein
MEVQLPLFANKGASAPIIKSKGDRHMPAKKIKLDAETKKKMLGLFPVNNEFTVEFTPEEYNELPEEIRPVFVIKPWNEAQCKAMGKEYEKDPDQDSILDKVRQQVVGLKNLINLATETEVAYEEDPKGGMSKTLFSLLPILVKTAILYHLLKISGIQR